MKKHTKTIDLKQNTAKHKGLNSANQFSVAPMLDWIDGKIKRF